MRVPDFTIEFDQSLLCARFKRDVADGATAVATIVSCVERRKDFIEWIAKSPEEGESFIRNVRAVAKSRPPTGPDMEREARIVSQWAVDGADEFCARLQLSAAAVRYVLALRIINLVVYVRVRRAVSTVQRLGGGEGTPTTDPMSYIQKLAAAARAAAGEDLALPALKVRPVVHGQKETLLAALESFIIQVREAAEVPDSKVISKQLQRTMNPYEWKVTESRPEPTTTMKARMTYLAHAEADGAGKLYRLCRDKHFFLSPRLESNRTQARKWIKHIEKIIDLPPARLGSQ